MTTTTRAAKRPMSAPNVPLVLMTVLWEILLSVVVPLFGCGVSVLIAGCLLVDISLPLPSPGIFAGVHLPIVGIGVGGVDVVGC